MIKLNNKLNNKLIIKHIFQTNDEKVKKQNIKNILIQYISKDVKK